MLLRSTEGTDEKGTGEDQTFGADRPPDARLARLHTRLSANLARQLRQAVPDGWEVSTERSWKLGRLGEVLLNPSVSVHRRLETDAGLTAPPTLCVSIAAGPSDCRAARAYARLGVDHYWHLDSRSGVLEVFVRADEDYRHAETLTIADNPVSTRPSTGPATDRGAAEWVDFGIGVVHLAVNLDDDDVPDADAGAPPKA